ncbi:hypothetical protein DFJ73DRAFT_665570 [Zopfochytrium polystomum]|nr:hypothetical protein DFJ73DRAFT_665570 [Zopfochytrium polystomum]
MRYSAAVVVAAVAIAASQTALPTLAATLCDSSSTTLTSSSGQWCVTSTGDSTGTNTIVTVYTASTGWFGLCIGSNSMSKGDMVIGYSSGGSVKVGSYVSSGHDVSVNSNPTWTEVALPSTAAAPAWAKMRFSASRPNNAGAIQLSPKTKSVYMIAYSNSAPSSATSIQEHDTYIPGTSAQAFSAVPATTTTGGNSTTTGGGGNSTTTGGSGGGDAPIVADSAAQGILTGLKMDTVFLIHGGCMFVAWSVAPFIGIFIARYLKDALGVWWYRLHLSIMLGGVGLLSVIGLLIIYLYKPAPHFETFHQKAGLAIEVILVLQIVLGFVSNAMWSPTRPAVPWWDKAHWWIGRLLTLVAVVNVYAGFNEYDEASAEGTISPLARVLFWVWIGAAIVALVVGQFKYGQIHHVAGHAGASEADFGMKPSSVPTTALSTLGRGAGTLNGQGFQQQQQQQQQGNGGTLNGNGAGNGSANGNRQSNGWGLSGNWSNRQSTGGVGPGRAVEQAMDGRRARRG